VLVLLLSLAPHWSFEGGLRLGVDEASGNACLGEHGTSRRLWHSSKMFFLVIMVWELCFMPWMSWDVWLHHITVIAGVVISTDPHLSALLSGGGGDSGGGQAPPHAPTRAKEILDGYAYVIMVGTAFMFAKELMVLVFQHRKRSAYAQQSTDLLLATAIHLVGQSVFYLAWPTAYVALALAAGRMGAPQGGLLSTLLVALNVLEAYIFSVTFKVMLAKRKKAQAAALRTSTEP